MVAIIVPGRFGPMIVGATAAAGGGFTLKAHAIVSGLNSPLTTSAIDTTGANLIVIVDGYYAGAGGGTLLAPTDNKGNTYTGLTRKSTTNSTCRIWYCASPTVGSGHTFTLSASLGIIAGGIAVQAWSGANIAPFDVENGTTNAGVTSVQPGSVTPNNNNSLIIAGVSTDGAGSSFAINSSFTVSDSANYSGGNNDGIGAAYFVQGAAAAINPTWSWTGSAEVSAPIAVFKP